MALIVSEDDIRARAYELWLDAGSPDGRAEEFWEQARLQLAELGTPTTSSDLVVDSDDFAEAPNAEPKSGNEPP
jgi:hypothetical protein